MASLQRFDGPSLEAVLADVHAAHGESARILHAHRVRAGGIGGFFARERFEVEVEVAADGGDGGDPAPPAAPVVRVPTSILELADDVSARESVPPASRPAAVPEPDAAAPVADAASAPASFASLLAARLASEHARSTFGPGGHAPGPDDIAATFRADVAAPVADRLGPPVTPPPADRPTLVHPGVAAAVAAAAPPAVEVLDAVAAVPSAPEPVAHVALVAESDALTWVPATRAPAAEPAPAPAPVAPLLPDLAPPAGEVLDAVAPAPAAPAPAPEPAPHVALVAESEALTWVPATRAAAAPPEPAPSLVLVAESDPLASVPATGIPAAPATAAPAAAGGEGPGNLRLPALAPLFEVDPFVARLTRRGLPVALVPAGRVADVRAAVIAALEGLPPVPTVPAGRTGVIVTVGEREEAYALARRLGCEHGAEEDHVVLASPTYRGRRIPAWGRLATVDEAVSERRSWRRRTGVTVVAVEAPVDGDTTDWAAAILAALEPNLTWGVVSAGRKPEDLAWWLERLGGVDALAVEGSRRTMTPGSVLSLGVPVGLLDGERPTAETWADLVLAGADR